MFYFWPVYSGEPFRASWPSCFITYYIQDSSILNLSYPGSRAVCCTGVGSNSIFCKGCKHWVHKKCSGLKRLTEDPDYRCTRCKGTARPLDGRPQKEVQVGPDKLEVVASFCYLGGMLSAAGGCELSTTTGVKTTWKKFKELKPVLSSRHLSFKTRGRAYSTCVRSAMLHASETWPVTKPCLQCLQRNDRAMIRQICIVKPQDTATEDSVAVSSEYQTIEIHRKILKNLLLQNHLAQMLEIWYVALPSGPIPSLFKPQS